MCLITTNCNTLVADNDIVCYKFASVDDDGCLHAPYRPNCVYHRGDLHTEINLQKTAYPCNSTDNYGYKKLVYYVDVGWHSLKSKEDCVSCISNANESLLKKKQYVVLRCIIPKGTKYYYGLYGNKPAYCSEQIIIDTKEQKSWFNKLKNKLSKMLEG